jgi:hypothetical protein
VRVTACRTTVDALLVIAQTIAAGRRDELERTVDQESARLAEPLASEQTPAAARWPRVQPLARSWAGCRQRDAAETSPDELVALQAAEVPPAPMHPRSEAAMEVREVSKVPEALEMLTASQTLTALTARTPLPQAVMRE